MANKNRKEPVRTVYNRKNIKKYVKTFYAHK